ncbi:hypothetical protein NP493_817g01023 [Ridgeia piscesae]|uniref:Uncharacterized protein n=1 Tax=Ridgeia piscesae TaxID=27915 RepID=A0AAD9NMU6_RIDPI|nr:hypothetical protein NP493_817g01023 [Ridgeia piscesae]
MILTIIIFYEVIFDSSFRFSLTVTLTSLLLEITSHWCRLCQQLSMTTSHFKQSRTQQLQNHYFKNLHPVYCRRLWFPQNMFIK